jgi:two-component system chemotaxis response regulator CheB
LVVVGASTGGPRALSTLVSGLPNDGRTAYLIVQHMPAGFTRSLADRLNTLSPLSVREAVAGDQLEAGTALVAPGDHHLRVRPTGLIELDSGERVHGVRPAVDVTLASVAAHFGKRAMAVVLTGMGCDGADGAAALHQVGGYVLAEDEATCVVWGMPRAVVERGVADRVVPLDGMATAIVEALALRPLAVHR